MEFPMISCEVWRSFLALFKLMNDDQSVVSPMVSTVGGIWDLQQELSDKPSTKMVVKHHIPIGGFCCFSKQLRTCFFWGVFLWAGL